MPLLCIGSFWPEIMDFLGVSKSAILQIMELFADDLL